VFSFPAIVAATGSEFFALESSMFCFCLFFYFSDRCVTLQVPSSSLWKA
jgi:hypothetical protein